jgi:tetratricopeptide (TPR) repeat protein
MAHTNLGVIYTIQKNYELAVAEYEAVQKTNPDDPEGYYGAAKVYLMMEKYDKGIENAKKAVEMYEAADSHFIGDGYYLLGLGYFYKEDTENAKIYIDLAKQNGVQVPESLLEKLK